jgi:CheY-like chemotaxis protein
MQNIPADTDQILDLLDRAAARDPAVAQRHAARRTWRKRMKVMLTDPAGNTHSTEVVTRDLSRGGLSFLNNNFMHMGTRCTLQLITADNVGVEIQATVVRCRHVAGRVHEVGLRFDQRLDQPLDEGQLASHKLSASILIVDDSEAMLRLTAHFLSKAGAQVETANGGERALELVGGRTFDLVIVDVAMPGISGPALTKTLRERGLTIPIIAYTADDDPATRETCLAAGCSDFLTKSLGKTEFLDSVARYLAVDEPIRSRHAGNPEMAPFIHDFVTTLPAKIQELQRCVQARKDRELGHLAREFTALASDNGGCGFAELSKAADALARKLTGTIAWAAVEQAMATLDNLAHRVVESGG